jgi:hypothetical protein
MECFHFRNSKYRLAAQSSEIPAAMVVEKAIA